MIVVPLLHLHVLCIFIIRFRSALAQGEPKFAEPINNITTFIGRDVMLTCEIDNLSIYKVAWLRVDTQTILTIHHHVVTKNHRIHISHSEQRNWYLHIKDVRESDRGWYMCQLNTDPMSSQMGYLQIVVPPDILDYPTSKDVVVREGSQVTIRCSASGYPEPVISWRRENGDFIDLGNGKELMTIEGAIVNFTQIHRQHMGTYLCIASNGIPPPVSKRISVVVNFAPMVWVQKQLIGALINDFVTIECYCEAFPKPINYWMFDNGQIIPKSDKYETNVIHSSYKVHLQLTIRSFSLSDFGTYKCVSKNIFGESDGTVKIYKLNFNNSSNNEVFYKSKRYDLDTDKNQNDNAMQQSSKSGTVAYLCAFFIISSLISALMSILPCFPCN